MTMPSWLYVVRHSLLYLVLLSKLQMTAFRIQLNEALVREHQASTQGHGSRQAKARQAILASVLAKLTDRSVSQLVDAEP